MDVRAARVATPLSGWEAVVGSHPSRPQFSDGLLLISKSDQGDGQQDLATALRICISPINLY